MKIIIFSRQTSLQHQAVEDVHGLFQLFADRGHRRREGLDLNNPNYKKLVSFNCSTKMIFFIKQSSHFLKQSPYFLFVIVFRSFVVMAVSHRICSPWSRSDGSCVQQTFLIRVSQYRFPLSIYTVIYT